MSIIGNNILAGASGNQGYEIERSLRFNDDDTAYLDRDPSSAGNRKTWTWSGWVKKCKIAAYQGLFSAGSSAADYTVLRFQNDDQLVFFMSNATVANVETTQVFRDVSAWYHIVLALDTTQATAANRVKIYVNGAQVTNFSASSYPAQNTDGTINNTVKHVVGTTYNSLLSLYLDGYMAEVNFVDGTALGPSDFGETDSDSGAWIPKKYNGTYGTNGFYLNFSDNSGVTATTLGKDSSGNGNNFTPNNFSVTAGAGNDSLEDTPTNNYPTLNPLDGDTSSLGTTLKDGNLIASGSTYAATVYSCTFQVPLSGKWYWEVTHTTLSSTAVLGIRNYSVSTDVRYYSNGNKIVDGSVSAYGSSWTTNDVIGVAVDRDSGTVQFYKNNTGQGSISIPNNNVSFDIPVNYTSPYGSAQFNINFGQRAFAYTPPTGFEALNTANLPVPTVKNGTEYFNTVLYTGDGTSSQTVTGVGFQSDFIWIKGRSLVAWHRLQNTVTGINKLLYSNSNNSEATDEANGHVSSVTSDGFVLADPGANGSGVNGSGETYVAWNWKAGGSGSANTDGTISSTVSANADAGFSIVSYTGNGTAGATIGHDLGVTPAMMIVKNRDATDEGQIYHQELDASSPEDYYLKLFPATTASGQAARATIGSPWNDTAPTSSVFSVSSDHETNASGEDYIAYVFAEVEGYSKFGSYTGNGSTDGTFVYTGFRPAFVMAKRSDSSGSWYMFDNTRATFNETEPYVLANVSNAEATDLGWDLLSNGFKHRTSYIEQNTSNGSYIYMAFAETPFKYANAA